MAEQNHMGFMHTYWLLVVVVVVAGEEEINLALQGVVAAEEVLLHLLFLWD
jgi:hypothetical protein